MTMIDHSKFKGHTPGPWFARTYMGIFVETAMGYGIADLSPISNEDIEEQTANAALVAAAPDLLAENKRLRDELSHLVRLLEPLEQSGELQIPGLATLNGARAALSEQK